MQFPAVPFGNDSPKHRKLGLEPVQTGSGPTFDVLGSNVLICDIVWSSKRVLKDWALHFSKCRNFNCPIHPLKKFDEGDHQPYTLFKEGLRGMSMFLVKNRGVFLSPSHVLFTLALGGLVCWNVLGRTLVPWMA